MKKPMSKNLLWKWYIKESSDRRYKPVYLNNGVAVGSVSKVCIRQALF